jgi:DNA-binding NarL/FixJ family response regulator
VAAAAALFAAGREMTAESAVVYALAPQAQRSGHVTAAPSGPVEPTEPAWTDPALLAAALSPRHAADGQLTRGASPLTPREYEIVLLIGRGLSNKEIADELVISPATAARHVANILGKLGFSSRTQVASWAARHEPPRPS